MKPLVLFVHGSAELYGSDKVLLNLASAFVDDPEFQPVVVLNEQGPLQRALQAAGVETHVGTVVKIRRAMLTPAAPVVLWRECRRAAVDLDRVTAGRQVGLVYSNTLAVLGGAYWAWRRGHRHLWHVHEIIQRPALVRLGLGRLAQWWAHRIVCNSQQTLAWLLAQAPALAARAVVVHNGLGPTPAVDPVAAQRFRSRLGLQSTDLLVTVAGRLNHWKGQDLLIDAAALLARDGRLGTLHFAIVGDVFAGHEDIRTHLVRRAQQEALRQRVHFVPFVDDIQTVWCATDIAVVPSLEPEPFGMVAIEAMACGVPVVAARHGGLLDIVVDGSSGLLFEPRSARALAAAVLRLARDPQWRRQLGLAGAARQAAQFSLPAQVARTRLLCLEMLR